MSKFTKKILFFDTETTWFVWDRKRQWMPSDKEPNIVQLAWAYWEYEFEENDWIVKYVRTISEQTFDHLYKSINPIPEVCSNIHWITDDMVKDKPYCYWCITFLQFLKRTKETDHICGHNVTYDIDMMMLETRRMFPKNDFSEFFDNCYLMSIDTMKVSTNLCKLPNARGWYKWPKLNELHKFLFNEDFDNAHNALADIEATKKCFFELVQKNVLSITK